MSIVDAVNRIQQIESQMVQLSGAERPAATGSTSSASPAGASAFASTLAAATGATGATVTPAAGQQADNGTTGAAIVADAQKYIGVPYVFGGTTSAGLDCSGLVQRVYGDLGISLPRLVSGQSTIGVSVPSLADAQPGDLIVCNGGEHIVIYAGDGKIIQAPKPGGSVEEMPNWISPSSVVTIRRIVPSAGTTGVTGSAGVAGSAGSGSMTAALSALAANGGSSALASLLGSGDTSALSGLLGTMSGSTAASPFGSTGSSGMNSMLMQLMAGARS